MRSREESSLSQEEESALKLKEYYDNRVAYFDSWVKAWIDNRMEVDKRLLTLSTLSIGLLISIFGKPETNAQFILWLMAGASFLICGLIILKIFHENTKYIEILLEDHQVEDHKTEKVILGKKEAEKSKQLNNLTTYAFFLLVRF